MVFRYESLRQRRFAPIAIAMNVEMVIGYAAESVIGWRGIRS